MRQLTYVSPGRLAWRDVPAPALEGPGEALVRPTAAARCDLDRGLLLSHRPVRLLGLAASLHIAPAAFRGGPFRGPYAYGHEGVGEVVACGEAVRTVSVGQTVVVPFQISCGACERCARGLTGSCAAVPPLSVGHVYEGGGPVTVRHATWGPGLSP